MLFRMFQGVSVGFVYDLLDISCSSLKYILLLSLLERIYQGSANRLRVHEILGVFGGSREQCPQFSAGMGLYQYISTEYYSERVVASC